MRLSARLVVDKSDPRREALALDTSLLHDSVPTFFGIIPVPSRPAIYCDGNHVSTNGAHVAHRRKTRPAQPGVRKALSRVITMPQCALRAASLMHRVQPACAIDDTSVTSTVEAGFGHAVVKSWAYCGMLRKDCHELVTTTPFAWQAPRSPPQCWTLSRLPHSHCPDIERGIA